MTMTATQEFDHEAEENSQILERSTVVTEDGFVVDTETGETIAMIDDNGEVVPLPAEQLTITHAEADLLMRRIQRKAAILHSLSIEFREVSEEMRSMEAEALRQLRQTPEWLVADARANNLDALMRTNNRDMSWMTETYTPTLTRFAQAMTSGKRSRTWKSEKGYGALALARSKGSMKILDDAQAVNLARELGLTSAITEHVTNTELVKKAILSAHAESSNPDLSDEARASLATTLETISRFPTAVEVNLPTDKLSIKTL